MIVSQIKKQSLSVIDHESQKNISAMLARFILIVGFILVTDVHVANAVAESQVESIVLVRTVARKAPPKGEVAVGFAVARNGFSFSNWGGLTPDDALTFANMSRLLGTMGTCLDDPSEPSCTLRNGQRLDLSTINAYVANGRCEGMSVLAAHLFSKPADIATFDSRATAASELTKDETAHELAYVSMTQLLPEIRGFSGRTKFKKPYVIGQEILFQMKLKRFVSLGIYGDGTGHSILPISVKYSPRSMIFSVYDPNFPNEVRTLTIDHLRDSWSYDKAVFADGSVGPLEWTGSGRLDYVPVNLRFTGDLTSVPPKSSAKKR